LNHCSPDLPKQSESSHSATTNSTRGCPPCVPPPQASSVRQSQHHPVIELVAAQRSPAAGAPTLSTWSALSPLTTGESTPPDDHPRPGWAIQLPDEPALCPVPASTSPWGIAEGR
jgi:hypothetical protein